MTKLLYKNDSNDPDALLEYRPREIFKQRVDVEN